jgi:hypothetical protein
MEASMRTMVLVGVAVLFAGCATFWHEYVDGDGQRRVEWRCPPWWCTDSYSVDDAAAVSEFTLGVSQGFRGHGPLKP